MSRVLTVVEAIQNGADNVEPSRLHALADELQQVAERFDGYEPLEAGEPDPLRDLPPFPPLGAMDLCMFCNQDITDRRFAVAITTRPEWHPDVYLHYSAHVECLRRAVHPDIGAFGGRPFGGLQLGCAALRRDSRLTRSRVVMLATFAPAVVGSIAALGYAIHARLFVVPVIGVLLRPTETASG